MNARHVAAPSKSVHTLADRLAATERLPLDLALSLAVEIIEAVARAHQQRRTFGQLTAAELILQHDGSIAITAPSTPNGDHLTDTFAVGGVLYQLFTGLTVTQARARLAVSPLHDVPSAALLNPAIDDTLEGLLSLMLQKDPAKRPHSLRVVETLLLDVCENLDLEPSRAAVLAWAQTPIAVKAPVPAPKRQVVHRRPPVRFADAEDDEEEEDDDDVQPASTGLRFDLWTAAAAAFCVVAFAMATSL